ncbi:MAG: hypothetical protein IJ637_02425 [Prevotella sp.]|nr:hypothetical protein [Prevotella sp.]
MTKKIITLALVAMMTLGLYAQQQRQKFSPEKFETDMMEYITREAKLSQQESGVFFPLLKEMHTKQREVYGRMRELGKNRPADEKAFAESVKQVDKLNIELKQIEEKYHQKMLKVVAASKVYDAIKAENRFHRQMMKNWQKPEQGQKQRPRGKKH